MPKPAKGSTVKGDKVEERENINTRNRLKEGGSEKTICCQEVKNIKREENRKMNTKRKQSFLRMLGKISQRKGEKDELLNLSLL